MPKRARTMGEIARGRRFPIHKSYAEREDLRVLAVCNNINGPIAPSGLMTLDNKKVTCKRCLRIIAGKPIARAIRQGRTYSSTAAQIRRRIETQGRTETERCAQLAALEARAALKADAVKFVERLALCWVAEGTRGDEPGSAREAFELLVEHGYKITTLPSPCRLYRPDGSEVTRC